jgi:DNA adenine methylase Dam
MKEQLIRYYKSIPYTGTKNKLLDFIVPKIEQANPTVLISPFCGSLAVEMNVKAEIYYLNDKLSQLINTYKSIKQGDYTGDIMIAWIKRLIKTFGLSNISKDNYDMLKGHYNRLTHKEMYPEYFLTIMLHSFNNQIRFNKKGEFNLPFGKRTLNESNEIGVRNLCDFIVNNRTNFTNWSFEEFIYIATQYVTPDRETVPLYYLDPPYNNTTATYNENNWNDKQEQSLYYSIDRINFYGNKFVMSNVLEHNGVENKMLKRYIEERGFKYDVIDYNYGNSSYNKKNRSKSVECIVYNY